MKPAVKCVAIVAMLLLAGCMRFDHPAKEVNDSVVHWECLYHQGEPATIGPGEVDNVVRRTGAYDWVATTADASGLELPSDPAVARFHLRVDRAGTLALQFDPHDGVILWLDAERVPDENLLATFGDLVLNLDEGAHTITFHLAHAGRLKTRIVQGGAYTAAVRVITR